MPCFSRVPYYRTPTVVNIASSTLPRSSFTLFLTGAVPRSICLGRSFATVSNSLSCVLSIPLAAVTPATRLFDIYEHVRQNLRGFDQIPFWLHHDSFCAGYLCPALTIQDLGLGPGGSLTVRLAILGGTASTGMSIAV